MEDKKIVDQINALAREEHELYEKESRGAAGETERERLQELAITLDQCWDLLRQRRARRSAGLDPDDAQIRGSEVVERYIG